jgi:hypothetical protein
MGLAVIDDDAHILDREAGDHAVGSAPGARPSRPRHEYAGDHAALDVVDELEAGAALQRLDLQVDLAELAGAARLLLVPAMALGLGR